MSDPLQLDRIICGDCLQILPTLPAESIDLVATDPPYGISFMGKDWDRAVPSVSIWKEVLRVLKPGALAFIMSIPRQDCLARMILNLEEAGFRTDFTSIYHCFATGFPKAENISRAVMKRLNDPGEVVGTEKIDVGIQSGHMHANRPSHIVLRQTVRPTVPETKVLGGAFGGFSPKPALEIVLSAMKPLERIDRVAARAFLGVDYLYTRTLTVPDDEAKVEKISRKIGFKVKPKDVVTWRITLNPALTDQTIINGEVVSNSPYSNSNLSSYLIQALKNRHGITWLDDCRIPLASQNDLDEYEFNRRGFHERMKPDNPTRPYEGGWKPGVVKLPQISSIEDPRLGGRGSWTTTKPQTIYGGGNGIPRGTVASHPAGRFPANLLCSDDILNNGEIRKSGVFDTEKHQYHAPKTNGKYGTFQSNCPDQVSYGEAGSFSRFFDLDSWWENKLRELPESVQQTFPFLIVPKASKRERNEGLEDLEPGAKYRDFGVKERIENGKTTGPRTNEQARLAKNFHSTVKPIKLMKHLVTLGSRPGDIVLDPFAGTGTTLIASLLFPVGQERHYLGIEIDPGYCRIAEKRVAWWTRTVRGLCSPMLLLYGGFVAVRWVWSRLTGIRLKR